MITPEFRDYPVTLTSAFGRVFYGANNRLYFSQIYVDDPNVLGRCYQINDPSSSQISDLLATDGGSIEIQNAGRIIKIEEYQLGVLVFADNGVWYVYGPESGFTAEGYTVQKITEFALATPRGVVNVGDAVFYCAEDSMYIIQRNEFGQLNAENITENTINTKYQEFISRSVFGVYDNANKQIVWVNPIDNSSLIYDLRAQGWYPQQFSTATSDELIASAYVKPQASTPYYIYNDTGNLEYNICTLTSNDFTDFGVNYDSYLVTAEESLGQFTHRKNVPNMYIIMQKTEENITGFDGSNFQYDKPSGCQFRTEFDYAGSASANTYTPYRSIYNVNRRGFLPANSTFPVAFDDGRTVVEFRDIIRGSGKSCRFRFQSEDGKDMQVLGYSVEYSMRGRQ